MKILKGVFVIAVTFSLIRPLSGWGAVKAILSFEKNKYLLDEALFYEVEIQTQDNLTSYFQWSSSVPSLELKDPYDQLVSIHRILPEYGYLPQTVISKHGRGIIEAEKLLPNEPYYIIAGSPISLSREKFKPGQYKARFPLLEYDVEQGSFKYIYSDWSFFEVVEPSGVEARVDSLLLSIYPLIKQIQYTKAAIRFKEVFEKYHQSAYAGTIMWELSGLRYKADEIALKFIATRPNSAAAAYGVWLLIADWSDNEYKNISEGKEARKKIESLAAKYKGSKVEEAIRKQLVMLEREMKNYHPDAKK